MAWLAVNPAVLAKQEQSKGGAGGGGGGGESSGTVPHPEQVGEADGAIGHLRLDVHNALDQLEKVGGPWHGCGPREIANVAEALDGL